MTDGAPQPTREARVIAALGRLDGAGDVDLIEQHASKITGAMLQVLASKQARGFDIGLDNGEAFAKPLVTKPLGLRRELEEFVPKVRKACAGKICSEAWTALWAAQPARIKALWTPVLFEHLEIEGGRFRPCRSIDRRTLSLGFEAPGYSVISPKPEIVLPMLEAALSALKNAPKSKKRTRNPDEDEAIVAVHDAYSQITGRTSWRVINHFGVLTGRFIELGREIDAVFGTALFSATDGRRFRR